MLRRSPVIRAVLLTLALPCVPAFLGCGESGAPVGAGGTTPSGGAWSGTSGGSTGGGGLTSGGSSAGGGTSSGGLPAGTGGLVTGGSGAGGGAPDGAGGASSGGAAAGGAASSGSASGSGGGASDQPITIWLAGDSTVANGNTPCPSGWGKQFEAEFNDLVTVQNSAAGGRSVRTWLYSVGATMGTDEECVLNLDEAGEPILQTRWSDMLGAMGPGDYLFIQFGINDGSPTCDRHVGLERFKQEYALMAAEARVRGATPVFVTPVSAIACNGGTPVGTRGGYVTATLEAGAESDVPVIDLHQLSIELYTDLSFCPVPDGDVSATTTGAVGDFFCDDHTHFSEAGAVSIGSLMAQAIADLGLPLAGYLE